MTFTDAKNVLIPFGEYEGKTLDKAAETDDGLRWLDWAAGIEIKSPRFKEALTVYLGDKTIAAEVARLVPRGGGT
jgi:hypothetical protein